MNDDATPDEVAQVHGFCYVMRDRDTGREFLAVRTFGPSRTRAKTAMKAWNDDRLSARKPPFEPLRVCPVSLRLEIGQPPVDNKFVAPGCERFSAQVFPAKQEISHARTAGQPPAALSAATSAGDSRTE